MNEQYIVLYTIFMFLCQLEILKIFYPCDFATIIKLSLEFDILMFLILSFINNVPKYAQVCTGGLALQSSL